MTTKVVDSTVSQILQDDSSVEYVAPETNPIATIPTVQTDVKNLTKERAASPRALARG